MLKQAAAVAAERLSRFKIDHRITGSPDLSLLLELELLYLGIEGKHSLWRSLDVLHDSRLAEFDFGKLAARARETTGRSRGAASASRRQRPARLTVGWALNRATAN